MAEAPIRRPVLVLIPGLLCDQDLWADQVLGLGDVARCHIADITHSARLADLAAAVLSEVPGSFALAGFSLGGYVAQEILRQAPGRVERLALLDTAIRADTPERSAARRALDAAAQMPGEFKGLTDRMVRGFVARSRLADEALVARVQAMTRRLGRDVFLRQNAVERVDGEAALGNLRGPLLVACGAEDALTPPADHRAMAALVPDARLAVFADCGHMAPMERPHEVTAALRAWLGMPMRSP